VTGQDSASATHPDRPDEGEPNATLHNRRVDGPESTRDTALACDGLIRPPGGAKVETSVPGGPLLAE